jgi:sortase A
MGAVGRGFIAVGVLLLLFVVYQLWGTGIQEARAQDDLREEFERTLVEVERATTTTTTAARPGASTTTTAPGPPDTTPPPPPTGAAVAIMRIPDIGLEKVVVEGVSVSDLKRAPGHYPGTPLPGQAGNAAIAGHRTTYGAPFGDLDELDVGDPILVTTRDGRFRYEVSAKFVVAPERVDVLDPTEDDRLTLTTCHPRYSARQRLIVVAALIGPAADAPPPTTTTTTVAGSTPSTAAPGTTTTTAATTTTTAAPDLLSAGLSGEDASEWPAVLWGALAGLVWLAAWLLGRRWRRWPAYLIGTPVFLVVLFVFFENVARLLPANV